MFRLCTISFSSNVLNIGWFWMEWPLHETAFSFSCHAVLISIAIKKKNLMVFKNLFYINYQKDASIQKNWTDDHWESAVVKQAQTCASSAYNRVMFKTSQQFTFHLSGSCNYCVQPVKHGRLSGWHWRPWRGGTVRWEMIGKSNGDFLTRVRYQEIALTRCSFSIKNFLLTLWLPLVSFALFLFCRHSLPYLLVLTFQFLVVCTISLSSPPIHTPARSIHTTVVPTGIVIPPPQRRLNDFILPCLCLLLLMMRLVPSCFDVDYQSLPLCVGNEGGKITCEEFKGSRKSRLLGGFQLIHKHPLFYELSACFPLISVLRFWNPSCLMIVKQTWSLKCSSGAVRPTDIPQKMVFLSFCFREAIIVVSMCDAVCPCLFGGISPHHLYLDMKEQCDFITECWLQIISHAWMLFEYMHMLHKW